MQLTQQETNKIKERDEQHTQELREWRNDLAKKKQVTMDKHTHTILCVYVVVGWCTHNIIVQVLEEEFRNQREERDKFYSADRPLPKQLRASLSMPENSWDEAQRSTKARSVSDLHQLQELPAQDSPHKALDDVVLGLSSTDANSTAAVANGKDT